MEQIIFIIKNDNGDIIALDHNEAKNYDFVKLQKEKRHLATVNMVSWIKNHIHNKHIQNILLK